MTHTDRFTRRLSTLARRSSGRLAKSSTPRYEALAIGLGCGRGRLATASQRPEWR